MDILSNNSLFTYAIILFLILENIYKSMKNFKIANEALNKYSNVYKSILISNKYYNSSLFCNSIFNIIPVFILLFIPIMYFFIKRLSFIIIQ